MLDDDNYGTQYLSLESSSYPRVMSKQLPKYEGLLKPQPIEIELRGRLPSYEVDKAIEKISLYNGYTLY